jgi:hypothetical protein
MAAGREGGARIAPETINGRLVIHNYGAGGTGFQAGWFVCHKSRFLRFLLI